MKGETVYYEVVGFTDNRTPIMGDCQNKKLNDKEFIKQYGETTTFSYGCSATGRRMMYGSDEYGDFKVDMPCPQSDCYVYRMTMTNEDGFVVEYTPDFMRYRCEQMGIKTVPVFEKFTIPAQEDLEDFETLVPPEKRIQDTKLLAGGWVMDQAEKYYDGPDPIGETHVREGVVVRILNRPKFCAYKHKNFAFKCLEGIVKADAAAPDMEESQEVTE